MPLDRAPQAEAISRLLSGGDRCMAGGVPVLVIILVCIAVIVLGPTEYVSLAGFTIVGAMAAVMLSGGGPVMLPMFALAGVGAALLLIRTLGKVAGAWDQEDEPPQHAIRTGTVDDTGQDQQIWR